MIRAASPGQARKGAAVSGFAVTTLDEIDPLEDGRTPLKPVRHRLGITAFGVNAWTAREAGDRMIP